MADHSRLGRGLASLIGDVGEETSIPEQGRRPRRARVKNLKPNPRNPRRTYTETELTELADQTPERGFTQPIVVRSARDSDDMYEIIAGERRWRAAQRAGLHEVPITVVAATDAQALEFAIIENVQRADLNPIEEAAGYQALMEEFNHSQEEVAQIVGKSRPHVANTLRLLKLTQPVKGRGTGHQAIRKKFTHSREEVAQIVGKSGPHVANTLRLLKLSEPVKAMVQSAELSAGHARILVGLPNQLG